MLNLYVSHLKIPIDLPEGVTCAWLRFAHVTPLGVTSQNPDTLYTVYLKV